MKTSSFLILALFIFHNLSAQDSLVNHRVFSQFQKKIELELDSIGKVVNDGNTALNIAEKYSNSADKLSDRFLYHVDILLSLTGVIIALLGGGVFLYFKSKFSRLEKNLDQKSIALNAIADQKFKETQDKIDKTIEEHKNEVKRKIEKAEMELNQKLEYAITDIRQKAQKDRAIIDRLMDTEKNTVFIKEQAQILFIQQEAIGNKSFNELKRAVFSVFDHDLEISIKSLEHLNDHPAFSDFLNHKSPLKLIAMNDDLFKSLGTTEEDTKRLTKEAEEIANRHLFQVLKNNKIGLALFGDMLLSTMNLPYLTYSKVPASLYGNVNNLLKYMMADKDVKV